MSAEDIRWKQRLNNFSKALNQMSEAMELGKQRELSKLELLGLIQIFKYNYELAWNTIKDFLEAQGETNIYGSRDAFRLAFRRGLIEDGEAWMDMIKDRGLTTHTYNEETADKIAHAVKTVYYGEIEKINSVLSKFPEVEKAILYGSRAKGNFKRGSDIDLTLIGSGLTHQTLLRIDNELDDLLLPYHSRPVNL